MGCNASSQQKDGDNRREARDFMSQDEIRIVKESWTVVAQDMPAVGLTVFTRLFEIEKDLTKFFRRLMTQNESGEFIFDTFRLEHHATAVMKKLGQAVENLEDSEDFGDMLVSLGEKHHTYNVRPEMTPFVWLAVRDALKMGFGEKFTSETELAWKHLFDYVAYHMGEGMSRAKLKDNKKTLKVTPRTSLFGLW